MAIKPHIQSYYAATVHPAPQRPVLADSVECDVCVVGGGIAGCSAALHLAERGYRVVLLEENRIGWGASGRSGAQAIYGVAAPQSKLNRLVGATDARAIGATLSRRPVPCEGSAVIGRCESLWMMGIAEISIVFLV